jgi:hypothetical protein
MMHSIIHLLSPRPRCDSSTEYVSQISHGSKIADHSGKPDLRARTIINAKAHRMLDGSRHDIFRNALRPVAVRQESMDYVQIEPGRIGADAELATAMFDRIRVHKSILNGASRSIHHRGTETRRQAI